MAMVHTGETFRRYHKSEGRVAFDMRRTRATPLVTSSRANNSNSSYSRKSSRFVNPPQILPPLMSSEVVWHEYSTEDGTPYYVNNITQESI